MVFGQGESSREALSWLKCLLDFDHYLVNRAEPQVNGEKRDEIPTTDPILAALALLFLSTLALAQHPPQVHFINVGQAESILLEFDKKAVLIDAGGKTPLMCNKTSTSFNT